MIDVIRSSIAIGVLAAACIVLPAVAPARAESNATIEALQQTPLSLFTYGLNGLSTAVNGYLGRGATPDPAAMFKAPLSGPVADFATVLYNPDGDTITVNLVKIKPLDEGATPNDACKQAFAAIHLFASLDPATGELQAGMTESTLTAFFTATGTPVKGAATDAATLDKAFRLRYNGTADGKRFRCSASLYGADFTVEQPN